MNPENFIILILDVAIQKYKHCFPSFERIDALLILVIVFVIKF